MIKRLFNDEIYTCQACDGGQWQKDVTNTIISIEGIDQRCYCYSVNSYLDANIGYDYQQIEVGSWTGYKDDLAKITRFFPKIDELKEQGRGFYIYSNDYGVGKTALANIFLKEAIGNGYTGLFIPFSELVILNSKIINSWRSEAVLEKSIQLIKNVDFLVLDDLAKEYDNNRDNGRATLNTILRYRDLWRKPTLYTSNVPLDAISEKYGGSNHSIIEGRSTIIEVHSKKSIRQHRKTTQENADLEEN